MTQTGDESSVQWVIPVQQFDPEKVDLFFESAAGKMQIIKNGVAVDYSEEEATRDPVRACRYCNRRCQNGQCIRYRMGL